MRQRLGLAAALLRPRELLVLDEPTNGLDPQGTREVRAPAAGGCAADGTTVFVSSHLLSEIEQVCTARRGDEPRPAGRSRARCAELRAAAGVRVRVETPQPAGRGRVLAGSAWPTPSRGRDGVVAELGDACASDRGQRRAGRRRRRRRGFVVERPDLEDAVRGADGGGLRCRRAERGRPPRPAGTSAAARRASADLRLFRSELRLVFRRRRNSRCSPCSPLPGADRHRGAGRPRRPTAAAAAASSARSPTTGCSWCSPSLTVLLPFFLPLAVAVASGDAIAGEASIGTLRYLLVVPVSRTRLLLVKYAGIVVFAFAAHARGRAGRRRRRARAVPARRRDPAVRHDGLARRGAAGGRCSSRSTSTVMLAGLAAIGLFISTLTEVPIGAMAATAVLASSARSPTASRRSRAPPVPVLAPWLSFGDLLRSPSPGTGCRRGPDPGRLHRGLPAGRVGPAADQGHHRLSPSVGRWKPGGAGQKAQQCGPHRGPVVALQQA